VAIEIVDDGRRRGKDPRWEKHSELAAILRLETELGKNSTAEADVRRNNRRRTVIPISELDVIARTNKIVRITFTTESLWKHIRVVVREVLRGASSTFDSSTCGLCARRT
jgi:hypothetical protein